MRSGLLWFLPDEALPLIVIGLGIALILGILTGRTVLGILGLVLLFFILSPFVEGLFGAMPPWISLLVLVIVGLAILRALSALFIGQRAADTMVGSLAADVVRLVIACVFLPFRMVGWTIRMISNGRI